MDLVKTFVFVRKTLPLVEEIGDFQRILKLIFTNLVHNNGKLDFELNLIGKMLLEVKKQDMVGPLGTVSAPEIIKHYFYRYCEELKAA